MHRRLGHAPGGTLRAEPGDAVGVASAGASPVPDPTSRHESTLGAAIANNASGPRSFRYGATRPWVEAVEVVLPTLSYPGMIVEIEAVAADA